MPGWECPHCEYAEDKLPNIPPFTFGIFQIKTQGGTSWGLLECPMCHRAVYVYVSEWDDKGDPLIGVDGCSEVNCKKDPPRRGWYEPDGSHMTPLESSTVHDWISTTYPGGFIIEGGAL